MHNLSRKPQPDDRNFLSIPGYDYQLDDFSLEGSEKKLVLIRETLGKFADMKPQDEIDLVAAAVMQERLTSELALYESYENPLK